MTWVMPPETAPQERVWMAFPREGATLGQTSTAREAGFLAWATVANHTVDFIDVTMIVDPSETRRAKTILAASIELVERPVGEFWMRDTGPTFVLDEAGKLGAVDWVFNGWGGHDWSNAGPDEDMARFIAGQAGAECLSSKLVNEGGGLHVDGAGTVFLTETVQRDPARNPGIARDTVEQEMARLLGVRQTVWLPRGLTRDYDDFGTSGHVDIVATCPAPGRILLHAQNNPEHPDHEVMAQIKSELEAARDASGNRYEIIDMPAPEQLRDNHGWVDYSYINHLVTNGAVIACGFGEERADSVAFEILAQSYPGREIVMLDARELFARGGGIHCITQQQPRSVK